MKKTQGYSLNYIYALFREMDPEDLSENSPALNGDSDDVNIPVTGFQVKPNFCVFFLFCGHYTLMLYVISWFARFVQCAHRLFQCLSF